jgi:hypothetical protein
MRPGLAGPLKRRRSCPTIRSCCSPPPAEGDRRPPGRGSSPVAQPPHRTSVGAPPNAAPNSRHALAIPIADPAQYAAQRYSHRRTAEPAPTRAATGTPTKIGLRKGCVVGHCAVVPPPLIASKAPAGASSGGKPATGSVTNSPEPITPTPAATAAPEPRRARRPDSSYAQGHEPRRSKSPSKSMKFAR